MIVSKERFMKNMKQKKSVADVQFAKIDPDYVSGRPRLIFDGESTVSLKAYPYLDSYTPAPNDRVQLLKGVIQGAII